MENRLDGHRTARVVVLNAGGVRLLALRHYLHGARRLGAGERARVREIDVVGLEAVPGRCDWWFGRTCTLVFLGGPLPTQLSDRFHLVSTSRAHRFTIGRYRSDRSVTVRPSDLVRRAQLPGSLVLLQS